MTTTMTAAMLIPTQKMGTCELEMNGLERGVSLRSFGLLDWARVLALRKRVDFN